MPSSPAPRSTSPGDVGSSDPAPPDTSEVFVRLRQREGLLSAVALAVARFVRDGDWRTHVPEVLGELCRATDLSRGYVFEAIEDENGERRFFLRWEWVAPDIARLSDELRLQAFSHREVGLERWEGRYEHGVAVYGSVAEFPQSEQAIFEQRGIVSVATMPIRCDEQLWGIIGFDDCSAPHKWERSEVEALQLVADTLGTAVARGRSDQELQKSEAEYRALFDAIDECVWVVDSDGIIQRCVCCPEDFTACYPRETVGQSMQTIIDSDHWQRLISILRDVLQTRRPQRVSYSVTVDEQTHTFFASIAHLDAERVIWVARDETDYQRTREELEQRDAIYRMMSEASVDALVIVRSDGFFSYISPVIERLLGWTPEEFACHNAFDLIHADDQSLVRSRFESLFYEPENPQTAIYRHRHKAGHWVWLEAQARNVVTPDGELVVYAVARDVTERIENEAALREAEARYRAIFENAIEGIFQTSPQGRYLNINPALARIYGFESPDQILSELTDIAGQLYVNPNRRQEFKEAMDRDGAVSNFESAIRKRDGSEIWISENARVVRDEHGRVAFYEGTVEDVTARKRAENQLLHDALHDRLTGLANRALFIDRVAHALARRARHGQNTLAVLFLDGDRFKTINDSLGHLAGDRLLVSMAQRIQNAVRPADTVARMGGDEFAVLLENIESVEDAQRVAQRIEEAMRDPFDLNGTVVFLTFSIGIAPWKSSYSRAEELLRDADSAMYRAKERGRGGVVVFDETMHAHAVAVLQLETDLRYAIQRQEFRLLYQPIVQTKTGGVLGYEALIRWNHPTRGLLAPGEFIAIAEDTGRILPIGNWVIDEACRQLAAWDAETDALQGEAKIDPPLFVAINLSSKQFLQQDLVSQIEEVVAHHNIQPKRLKLEITESTLMDRAPIVAARLRELRDRGFQLALDDFGTGYSSLSYLQRFPIHTLKIDRSFITHLGADGHEEQRLRQIVRTIVALGTTLDMDVVAEGVETDQAFQILRELGCRTVQGFYFGRPMPPSEALALSKQTW